MRLKALSLSLPAHAPQAANSLLTGEAPQFRHGSHLSDAAVSADV